MSSASRIGQSRYSTTLLLEGGRSFRVAKSQPSGFAVQVARYCFNTTAKASGRVTGAVLALLFVDCAFPYHAERRTWVRFPSPAPENEALTQRLHFPFFPNVPKSVPFFRETSGSLFRSNLVSVANKRVKQILRRSEPWSSPRSEAREASDVGFDIVFDIGYLLHCTRRSAIQIHASC